MEASNKGNVSPRHEGWELAGEAKRRIPIARAHVVRGQGAGQHNQRHQRRHREREHDILDVILQRKSSPINTNHLSHSPPPSQNKQSTPTCPKTNKPITPRSFGRVHQLPHQFLVVVHAQSFMGDVEGKGHGQLRLRHCAGLWNSHSQSESKKWKKNGVR